MLIQTHDLTRRFRGPAGEVLALDAVSLSVAPGEFLAIQGPSGCGKTTLLLILGALLEPTSGTVNVAGQDPYQLPPEARARFRASTVGFVFQQFHLVPYLSLLDNVLAAGLAARAADGRDRALALLDRFGLADRAAHRPAELSVGQKQRAALARALFNQPKVILADEPTGNLDAAHADAVLQAFSQFTGTGGTVLLATHDPRLAAQAHRVLHMAKGALTSGS